MNCPFCAAELKLDTLSHEQAALRACPACMNPYRLCWVEAGLEVSKQPRAKDIREIAPEGSIGGALLSEVAQAMDNLPVLPEISQRVLKMVKDPNVSMTDLAEVIQEDQVIAIKIMKLANSAVYGGLHEITDLNAACSRLGMKTISNAVQAVANGNLYITGDKRLREMMHKLWRHAVAAAYCAAELAQLLSAPNAESLFFSGLIHDIGRVVLLEVISNGYSGAIGKLRESPELFSEIVKNFHTLVGLHVVQYWNLPPEFLTTTYCHHEPEMAPNEEWMRMAHIIALADTIVKVEGYVTEAGQEEQDTFLVSHPSARYLNLSDIKIAALRVDLTDRLEAILEAMGDAA